MADAWRRLLDIARRSDAPPSLFRRAPHSLRIPPACSARRFRRQQHYVKGSPLVQTVCSFFYVSCSANIPPGAERTADYCFTLRATTIYSCPAIVRGCGGVKPPRGQGAEPLGHSRAFSDMYGERAPAMTRRGKRVSAERKECSGSPGESIFGGVKSRRFIAGVAEMNAWRRPVRAAGYCRASRTTAFYLHPAIVWEREGVTPSLTRLPTASCRRRGR